MVFLKIVMNMKYSDISALLMFCLPDYIILSWCVCTSIEVEFSSFQPSVGQGLLIYEVSR